MSDKVACQNCWNAVDNGNNFCNSAGIVFCSDKCRRIWGNKNSAWCPWCVKPKRRGLVVCMDCARYAEQAERSEKKRHQESQVYLTDVA